MVINYDPNIYGTFLEGFVISAVPQPTNVTPTFATIGVSKDLIISGKSFFRIGSVYLSGSPYTPSSTIYNPFSAYHTLSANYPPFNALQISTSSINVNSDSQITITIPPPSATGYFDIIIQNLAGYGKLSEFSEYYQNGILAYIDNSI